MITLLKKFLPTSLKQKIRNIIKFVRYQYRFFTIKRVAQQQDDLKIIVGAAETNQEGWFSTNEQWLDITKADHWARIFKNKKNITNVVSEHVFEHLTRAEAVQALKNISSHLKENGKVRIAVPDGYHPDPTYIKHVGINGIGDDAADHKQLLNVDELFKIFNEAGFTPTHLEGYSAEGELVTKAWDQKDGFIRRSRQNGNPNSWDFVDADTSLIVDGVKNG